ncbi:unnamed protein product [Paramecium pentaurelia]|uniref:Uncharacterized protein n=1 Tax=Paramecium pentaurelia TaxID=43138 RepID=A0A8S1YKZ4_9CILI|nr:unnamed protein product [Paramecium pentaurelia]
MVKMTILDQSVPLLMEIHQPMVVMITLSVYGMLKHDNKKPIQMVIIIMFTKSISLLMEINQFHKVMINQQGYGMQRQDKNFNTIEIVIRKFLDNLLDNNLQRIPLQLLLQLF